MFMHYNFSWYNLGTLSKDHTGEHYANMGENENSTLSSSTHLCSAYVAVLPRK